jgi:hypothetical protein
MTLSKIMINAPIVIAATAAAGLSSARAAFGLQHDFQLQRSTSDHATRRRPVEHKQDQT